MNEEALVSSRSPAASQTEFASFEEAIDVKEIRGTLDAIKPKTPEARNDLLSSLQVLIEHAVEGHIVPNNVVSTIKGLIAALDEKISTQMHEILHHDSFQQLESAWRGLHYLVSNTEVSELQKIRVMPASKKELLTMFDRFPGTAWDQSPLFKKVYQEEYGVLGGEPFGMLVGDYYFDNKAQDVALLGSLAQIAAASHAPLIAGVAPSLLDIDDWNQLSNITSLEKKVSSPQHAAWNAFRQTDNARYVALTLPRFLARLPYGAETRTVRGFAYEEAVVGDDPNDFCWANASYAMAVNINKAFQEFGWCTRIRGVEAGGKVSGLPVFTFPSDEGGVEMTCPTEVAIDYRREKELSDLGLLGLLHQKNTETGVFMGAQTLNRPAEYDDADASANAQLSARLPYIFAASRFAHYLNVMVYNKVGSNMEQEELRKYLSTWIMRYVCADPVNANEIVKAQQPLAAAEVVVEPIAENPGYYRAVFHVRPHYQLEGMAISMRLVSKLPNLSDQ